MAGEMLLINPSSRKRRRVGGKAKRRTTSRRRRNPITVMKRAAPRRPMTISRHRRRRNPISNLSRHRGRRRRNPIGGFGSGSSANHINVKNLTAMFKDAAVGGAGAVVFDLLMGQINQYLPASFQTQQNAIGAGDAVKALITAVVGIGANRITKGYSKKMAEGALTVQAWQMISAFLPATMTVGGLGWATPARIINGSARVGPSRGGMLQAYQRPGGKTALLNSAGGSYDRQNQGNMGAYMSAGKTALLNGATAQRREGVSLFK